MLRVSCAGDEGAIWFERGTVPHAETHDSTGTDAFLRILSWSGGEFAMATGESPPARTISMGWMELVLESCRQRDELTSREPAFGPMNDTQDDNSLDLEFDVTTTKKEHMPNHKDSVARLDSLDGFIGACLCDAESGMALATHGGNAALNLEVAAATNAEVLRAKRKAAKALNLKDDIEDILITLGKQYHIIRPLKAKPMVFFYLALDRAHSNLAMARMALAEVEREAVL